jgi:hypothetical protein
MFLIISFHQFYGFALWPWLCTYNPAYRLCFAIRESQKDPNDVYADSLRNNAILSYVSNILRHLVHPESHYIGSILLAVGIFIKPFFDEKIFPSFALIKRSPLLVFSFCYVAMLTLTAWSYDYRILYALPLLFYFLGEHRNRHTTQLLYLSIFF